MNPRITRGTRVHRAATVAAGCVLLALHNPAFAESKNAEPESATFSSRKDNKDGSSSLTFGARIPSAVETKVGVDLGLTAPADVETDPAKALDKPNERGAGAGWASMVVPAFPFGFTKAKVDARLDPTQDQSNFGMAVSRPVGNGLLMTLQNSYAVGRSVAPVPSGVQTRNLETGHTVRFDILATSTAFSAGTKSSTLEEKALRVISAEQKIVGPLSLTGSVSETPTGIFDKTLKAGFKKTW